MKKNKSMTGSENMSRVKSKNTNPEIFLRKLLWHKGFRYRVNYKELPGSPDSSIPKSNYEFRKINSKEMLKGTRKIMLSLKVWALK